MVFKSKMKGKKGELEVCKQLGALGIQAHRGQQYSGNPDAPDVVSDLSGIHFEVKRTKRFLVYDAMAQAKEDCGPGKIPTVAYKGDGTNQHDQKEWLLIIELKDLLKLSQEIERWKNAVQSSTKETS